MLFDNACQVPKAPRSGSITEPKETLCACVFGACAVDEDEDCDPDETLVCCRECSRHLCSSCFKTSCACCDRSTRSRSRSMEFTWSCLCPAKTSASNERRSASSAAGSPSWRACCGAGVVGLLAAMSVRLGKAHASDRHSPHTTSLPRLLHSWKWVRPNGCLSSESSSSGTTSSGLRRIERPALGPERGPPGTLPELRGIFCGRDVRRKVARGEGPSPAAPTWVVGALTVFGGCEARDSTALAEPRCRFTCSAGLRMAPHWRRLGDAESRMVDLDHRQCCAIEVPSTKHAGAEKATAAWKTDFWGTLHV